MRFSTSLIAAALLLTGCTGTSASSVGVAAPSPVSSSTAASAGTPSAPSPTSKIDVLDVAEAFARAIDADDFAQAKTYVKSGTAAERYVIHQESQLDAIKASGRNGAATPSTITVDKAAGTVTWQIDTWSAVWTEWQADSDLKLLGWTVKGLGPVTSLLWTQSASGSVGGASVKVVSAYANSNGLWVILDVTATGAAIAPDLGALLIDTKKRQREASEWYAPQTISAGASGYVLYLFEGATFGGTLTYKVEDTQYHTLGEVKLVIS